MNDNYNDFEQSYSSPENNNFYGRFGEPRWDDFTIDDEIHAKKRFSKFFLACLIYLAISFALVNGSYLVMAIFMGVEKADAFFSNPYVTMLSQVLFMYVIALPIFYLIVRNMRNAFRTKNKISVKEFVALFLVGEACMIGGGMISTLITDSIYGYFGIEVTDNITELVMNTPLWLVFAVAVVIGPIVEEFIYRKMLMDKLGMYGDRIAIIVSGVAFGLFHGDISQLFYATLLGFVLAYLYSKTSNMWYCVLLHSIINFFGSIIPMLILEPSERFLELTEMIEAGEAINQAEYSSLLLIVGGYSLLVYGMLFAGLFIFFKYRKRIFISDRCEILIPKRKRASVILLNFGVLAFIIANVAAMGLNLISPILQAITEGAI